MQTKGFFLMAALYLTMSAIDARAQQIATVTTNSWDNADLHVEGMLDKPTSAMLDLVGYDANRHEVAHSEGFDGTDEKFNVVLSDPQKKIRFVKVVASQLFVNDKADADATHIYFGPTDSVSLITADEMKADYAKNPKAYVQGWNDGWNWASKQPNPYVDAEEQGKQLYGDIDSYPGKTQFFAFLGAQFVIIGRVEARNEAETKPAVPGSPYALDRVGSKIFESTLRYIENETGVGPHQLIAPQVTFGPYLTTFNKQRCWLCKVTYHVPGDNGNHCILVYEEPVVGPEHVIGSEIDF
jgi:hypothetical protein